MSILPDITKVLTALVIAYRYTLERKTGKEVNVTWKNSKQD